MGKGDREYRRGLGKGRKASAFNGTGTKKLLETGEPCALKGASTVRRGAAGQRTETYLACRLLYDREGRRAHPPPFPFVGGAMPVSSSMPG